MDVGEDPPADRSRDPLVAGLVGRELALRGVRHREERDRRGIGRREVLGDRTVHLPVRDEAVDLMTGHGPRGEAGRHRGVGSARWARRRAVRRSATEQQRSADRQDRDNDGEDHDPGWMGMAPARRRRMRHRRMVPRRHRGQSALSWQIGRAGNSSSILDVRSDDIEADIGHHDRPPRARGPTPAEPGRWNAAGTDTRGRRPRACTPT